MVSFFLLTFSTRLFNCTCLGWTRGIGAEPCQARASENEAQLPRAPAGLSTASVALLGLGAYERGERLASADGLKLLHLNEVMVVWTMDLDGLGCSDGVMLEHMHMCVARRRKWAQLGYFLFSVYIYISLPTSFCPWLVFSSP
ncbi:hypothetical protein CC79DRAFT_1049780 [Sarocladium strictum]